MPKNRGWILLFSAFVFTNFAMAQEGGAPSQHPIESAPIASPAPPDHPPEISKVEPSQQPTSLRAVSYYCQKLNGYYPNITYCPEGWIAVPVDSPPAYAWPIQPYIIKKPFEMGDSRPNSINLELFGRSAYYSLNYDRSVSDHLTLGIGISTWHLTDYWRGYDSQITTVPIYGNYYFSKLSQRGFVSAGVDLIRASPAGFNNTTFANNGVAGVFGGGYEYREESGFLFRIGGFLIVGRTSYLNPSLAFGYSF